MASGTTGLSLQLSLSDARLAASLLAVPVMVRGAMHASALHTREQAVTYMKDNARWTDQTGNARAGLNGEVRGTPTSVEVVLYHSVSYGIYLETRWSGRYQIIKPTVEKFGPEWMKLLQRLLFGTGFGVSSA